MAMFNTDDFIKDNTPPDKRTNRMLAWLKALLSPLKYLADLIQWDYFRGAIYSSYNPATSYMMYERVQSGYSVYESLVNSNIGNAVTDTAYWMKILDEKVGLNERATYTCQKTMLEYALNKRYSGVFVQPPAQSDIYITKHNLGNGSFVTFNDSQKSSKVFRTYTIGACYNTLNNVGAYNITIHIPTALFTSDADVRRFVDRYVYEGTTYEIVTY